MAVLGAGIMGCSVALELARRGCQVVLVDAADVPFSGASRWNEGKLHLGYLYAGDPTLATARHVLPGGLAFMDTVRDLLGCDIGPAITAQDDLYLVHRDSVVDAAAMQPRFEALSALVSSTPGADRYPGDASRERMQVLSRAELDGCADTRFITAGFRVPERSVSTRWIADRYVEALRSEPGIELAMSTQVDGVKPVQVAGRERWRLETEAPIDGGFEPWSTRCGPAGWPSTQCRIATGTRLVAPLSTLAVRAHGAPRGRHSVVVSTGPFGDIKNYNGRDFYLSWYPAGLMVEGHDVLPPDVPAPGQAEREPSSRTFAAGSAPCCQPRTRS